jgi:hypothetical protein
MNKQFRTNRKDGETERAGTQVTMSLVLARYVSLIRNVAINPRLLFDELSFLALLGRCSMHNGVSGPVQMEDTMQQVYLYAIVVCVVRCCTSTPS